MSNSRIHDWTEARIALLSELWLAGIASGEIGRRLGITRSSVMGKLRRLGLLCRDRPRMPIRSRWEAARLFTSSEQVSKPEPAPENRPHKRNKRPAKSPDSYFAEFAAKPLPPPPSMPPIGSFALADLRHGHCRWPGPEHRPPYSFCGAPQASNSSYCEDHTKRSLSGLARGTPYVGQRMAR